jgi:nucleotide-binding universal stress UspA family protein
MGDIARILCPIDFSDFSRRALDHAVAIAHRYGSSVTALHVYTSLVPALVVDPGPDMAVPVLLTDVDREQLVAEAHRFVNAESAADVPIEVVLADATDVPREILARAGTLGADLVVIGSHGRSGFEHLVLGSVTEKVLRKAMCPVLTVPRGVPDAVPATKGIFTRILCAVDFAAPSSAALDYGLSLAATSGADLIALHVVEILPEAHEPFIDVSRQFGASRREYEARCLDRLHQMLSKAAPAAGRIETLVAAGKPYQEIVRLAHARGCDLIAVGVHGRNAIDRMLFGSTAQHVVRQASCPVLTVRSESS